MDNPQIIGNELMESVSLSAEQSEQSERVVASNVEGIQRLDIDANLHRSDMASLSVHNDQYTELLKLYVKNMEYTFDDKKSKKNVVYGVCIGILIAVPALVFMVIFCALILAGVKEDIEMLDMIPALITAIVALITSYLSIMKIITSYLFNKEEEKTMAAVISKIQEYDKSIRNNE